MKSALGRTAMSLLSNSKASLRSSIHALKAKSTITDSISVRVHYLIEWGKLLYGSAVHAIRGETPKFAHEALVNLFVMGHGKVNDRLAKIVAWMHPPFRLPPTIGVLGHLNETDLAGIQQSLKVDGYVVFENCLSAEFCESIVRQSLAFDCILMGDEAASKPEKERKKYHRKVPLAAKYLVDGDDATDIAEIQQLVCDSSLIAIAQNYLGSKPIFTGISLWWSPAVKDTPDGDAAQEFHWDMERIRWIRFFIYLTDVEADSGPHCFIKGTHITGAIPKKLLSVGYQRIKDEQIIEFYGRDRYREFVGPRGTIVAEDSRGFHKGKMPLKGDRLLLAFELSNTTFGANKRHFIRNIHVPKFAEFAKQYPRLYSNFDFRPDLLK
jgi:hypothetical protein